MNKFLAVVRHEYRKIVLRWSFVIGTMLFPLLAAATVVVPALIFSIEGEPVRIVVLDEGSGIGPRVREIVETGAAKRTTTRVNPSMKDQLQMSQEEKLQLAAERQSGGQVRVVDYDPQGKSYDESEGHLRSMVMAKEIDGYIIVPSGVVEGTGVARYFSRKAGDFVTNKLLEESVNEAVRAKRLADADIDETALADINRKVSFDVRKIDQSGETASEGIFAVSFVIGLMIYIVLAIYGQQVLGAVVEEKETRIAEILFSSASPFVLMLGKLVGVGLAALTQMSAWMLTAAAVTAYGFAASGLVGSGIEIPAIPLHVVGLFLLYFLLGFFLYASIFALIGSMVTTVQEGGQFSLPPILLLLVGFYFSTAVIRDPGSSVSFWVSVVPFLAPITMPVRIMAEMPPLWQILLSVAVNLAAIGIMVWLSGRVYRIGMLMYGKRATIPEVIRWIRTR